MRETVCPECWRTSATALDGRPVAASARFCPLPRHRATRRGGVRGIMRSWVVRASSSDVPMAPPRREDPAPDVTPTPGTLEEGRGEADDDAFRQRGTRWDAGSDGRSDPG